LDEVVIFEVAAEMVASVASLSVEPGASVSAGDMLVLLESMKMEIPVLAEHAGVVREFRVAPGDVVQEGDVLVVLDLLSLPPRTGY
jgi:biotin carboxyl carrier protein